MTTQSNTPVKKEDGTVEVPRSSGAEVDVFLARLKTITPAGSGRGRLIFAMDATMSRQPTWDLALGQQADMFRAVKEIGGTRRPARLFPRVRRNPREQVGRRPGGACAADDPGFLSGRLYPDPQSAHPCSSRKRASGKSTPLFMSATAWRKTSMSALSKRSLG